MGAGSERRRKVYEAKDMRNKRIRGGVGRDRVQGRGKKNNKESDQGRREESGAGERYRVKRKTIRKRKRGDREQEDIRVKRKTIRKRKGEDWVQEEDIE